MSECPICGDELEFDEEWRLRPGRVVGREVKGDDYAHKECL